MYDKEKFEDIKQSLIDENEKKYGAEIRGEYGDEVINTSNARLKGLTQEQYNEAEQLRHAYEETLKAAFEMGDPSGETARNACDLHRQWLCKFYPEYSKEYHKGLGDMYAADERFKGYYERIVTGCAEFLRDAIYFYCENNIP